MGRFFVTIAFGAVFVYASEVFPTSQRTAALGLCSAGARLGGAVAPLVVSIGTVISWLPLLVFGAVSVVASVVTAGALPETLGKPLAETVADCEQDAADSAAAD